MNRKRSLVSSVLSYMFDEPSMCEWSMNQRENFDDEGREKRVCRLESDQVTGRWLTVYMDWRSPVLFLRGENRMHPDLNDSSRRFETMHMCTEKEREREEENYCVSIHLIGKEIFRRKYLFSDILIALFSGPSIPISNSLWSKRKQPACHVTISRPRQRRNFNSSSLKPWVNHREIEHEACNFSASFFLSLSRYEQRWSRQLDWLRSSYRGNCTNRRETEALILFRSLVHRLERWSSEKCSLESITQTFGTTFSKVFLGFMRCGWCQQGW